MRDASKILGFAALAAMCAACSPQRDAGLSALDHASGTWGWKGNPASSCTTNPHTISFSADKNLMYLRHEKPTLAWDGKHRSAVHYRVEQTSPVLRLSLIGETRRTDEGERVAWDLRMISRDEYCWHRSDWDGGTCTGVVERCPASEGP
jgi:hypothetical protein